MYTSLIDQEIAHQKGVNDKDGLSSIADDASDIGGHTRHPLTRAPYLNKVPTLRAFREPVMSSTQKSFDVNVMSQSHDGSFKELPKSPRSSMEFTPRYLHLQQKGHGHTDKGSKVGFKENTEMGYDDAKLFSPTVQDGGTAGVFGDKSYMNYYKKLSQTDRKRELLRQRENLLDEQKRLKTVLRMQEDQLKNKQAMLHEQQELQKGRLDYFEKTGHFPNTNSNPTSQHNNVNPHTIETKCDRMEDNGQSDRNVVDIGRHKTPPKSLSDRLPVETGFDSDKENIFSGEVKKLDFDHQDLELGDDVDHVYITSRGHSPRGNYQLSDSNLHKFLILRKTLVMCPIIFVLITTMLYL